MITSINLKALSGAILAADTRKAIITNVERLWTYYKETYQEDKEDD